ncbi:MAG: ABC transporter permease [Flavobacteriales bacterium]|nr:ABC transporter permease [Flavobacteriales bacterium]
MILHLLKKEFITEFRHKISLNSIFLYLTSTVFIVYLIFNQLEELKSWVALYWIILVFASTNASVNSFRLESGRQFYYYFGLVKAVPLILSKMIFNAILIELIAFLAYGLIAILIGNPIENQGLFLLIIGLGSLALSSILTLVSGIASKTGQNSSLTAILAFPILLPVLLMAIKASLLSGLGFGWDECQSYLLSLLAINVVIVALSLILFPYLWRS